VSLFTVATRAVGHFAKRYRESKLAKELGHELDGEQFWHRVQSVYITLERAGLASRMPMDMPFDKDEAAKATESKPSPAKCSKCGKPADPADLDKEGACGRCADDVPM